MTMGLIKFQEVGLLKMLQQIEISFGGGGARPKGNGSILFFGNHENEKIVGHFFALSMEFATEFPCKYLREFYFYVSYFCSCFI